METTEVTAPTVSPQDAYEQGWAASKMRRHDSATRSESITADFAASGLPADLEGPFMAGWADWEGDLPHGHRRPKGRSTYVIDVTLVGDVVVKHSSARKLW